LARDITHAIEVVFSLIIAIYIIYSYIRHSRMKTNVERRIHDALIKYGCVEEPPFTPRSATAREVAHFIFKKDEYHYDLLTVCYLMKMEKTGDLGNSGETTDIPALAVKNGRWYINWNPPSE
jgi:hypothetical protein